MKKFFFLSVLSFLAIGAMAQNPVSWSGDFEKIGEDEYELSLTASIDKGWYVYSQFLEEGGPVATKITLNGESAWAVGDADEQSEMVKESYDSIFEMNVKKFGNEVVFKQKIKVAKNAKEISGTVLFMSCTDESCLPPKRQKFKLSVKNETFLLD